MNAERLGVDTDRIVAGGGSAGGHIAACTGVLTTFDAESEDASVSSVPNAMALFNPACVLASAEGKTPFDEDRTKGLRDRIGDDPKRISPYHHVKTHAPPTIVFHGKGDTTVAYWTAEVFTKAMKDAGNRCELVGFEGEPHGFFNYGRGDGTNYVKTVRAMDQFLASLGFLEGKPTVELKGK